MASAPLAAYRGSGAVRSAERGGLDPDRLVRLQGDTMYLVSPAYDPGTFAPVLVALIDRVLRFFYVRETSGVTLPSVVVALDEAANIASVPGLGTSRAPPRGPASS